MTRYRVWFMTDATTRGNALKMPFEDGGIDILENASDAYQISQLSQLDTVYVNYVDIGPVVLFPDSDDPDSPLSDVNVRKAISYAIDRDALLRRTRVWCLYSRHTASFRQRGNVIWTTLSMTVYTTSRSA